MKVEGCDGQTRCGSRGWGKGRTDSIETKTMKLPKAFYEIKFSEDLKFVDIIKKTWEGIKRCFDFPSYNRKL